MAPFATAGGPAFRIDGNLRGEVMCFASYNDVSPDDSMLGLPDKFCLLEDGHDGEHEWTPQSDIEVIWL
jgi:hypothetical protein